MSDTTHDGESALLDQLLRDAKLYRTSTAYKDLLDFAARMPHLAPYNAMLLQIQKPGLSHAAHATEWHRLFGRTIKENARPLLILFPFGPVSLVYDILDTEGPDLPVDAFSFVARGPIDALAINKAVKRLFARNIVCEFVDQGDHAAGSIVRTSFANPADKASRSTYRVTINRNHSPATQFATLAHELAHLFLGHIGSDSHLGIRQRTGLDERTREIEAESVSYLACVRHAVESRATPYLSNQLASDGALPDIDVYTIMRAAGAVEQMLRNKTSNRR